MRQLHRRLRVVPRGDVGEGVVQLPDGRHVVWRVRRQRTAGLETRLAGSTCFGKTFFKSMQLIFDLL